MISFPLRVLLENFLNYKYACWIGAWCCCNLLYGVGATQVKYAPANTVSKHQEQPARAKTIPEIWNQAPDGATIFFYYYYTSLNCSQSKCTEYNNMICSTFNARISIYYTEAMQLHKQTTLTPARNAVIYKYSSFSWTVFCSDVTPM